MGKDDIDYENFGGDYEETFIMLCHFIKVFVKFYLILNKDITLVPIERSRRKILNY